MAFPDKGRSINSINIVIAGAGRMGQAIAATIEQTDDLALAGIWQRGEDLAPLLSLADVVIDFSLPDGTMQILDAATAANTPVVSGVSGLTDQQFARLDAAAEDVALVYDRNMSLGIAVLERTVKDAAAALGAEFTVEISEVHHVHKKDAPSGTALKLAEAIAAARDEEGTNDISFAVERRGEVPGEHTVSMTSTAEKLTFAHSVTTRQVFADGALRAARWVVDQPAGRYSMQDVLFRERNQH